MEIIATNGTTVRKIRQNEIYDIFQAENTEQQFEKFFYYPRSMGLTVKEVAMAEFPFLDFDENPRLPDDSETDVFAPESLSAGIRQIWQTDSRAEKLTTLFLFLLMVLVFGALFLIVPVAVTEF